MSAASGHMLGTLHASLVLKQRRGAVGTGWGGEYGGGMHGGPGPRGGG